ncbi:MAG: DUF6510 family protein [Nitrospirota bacterium]
MIITCPKCELSKDLGEVRIYKTGTVTTCPRCRETFLVLPEQQETWWGKWKNAILFLAVVLPAAAFLAVHDWKLDKNYFLSPSTWQGDMTFRGKKYPFVLVIEKAQDGRLAGYMDWVSSSPRYRLAVRGTYVGNHLVFEDYAFLERVGATGLHDEKDVYISGNEMTGTDKNGAAELQALKRESSPL